jgi:hypothetical protein
MGRPAPGLRDARRATPQRADTPQAVLKLPPPKGPLRSLYVRGVLLAAPPWRRALSLAGRSNLSLHHACRNLQMAAAKEDEVVAVTVQALRELGEAGNANMWLPFKRILKVTRPLGGTSSSPK